MVDQSDGKVKLFSCRYDADNKRWLRYIDKLAEADAPRQVGLSTEKMFFAFMEQWRSLMPNASIAKARFFKDEIRGTGWAKGMYWNKSYLFIPIEGTEDYYKIAYFS